MSAHLNTGFGLCTPTCFTMVTAPTVWADGGKIQQFAATVLAAVHHHNRHAVEGEFIALDFPGARFKRDNPGKTGDVVHLVGSRTALTSVLESDRLLQFRPPVATSTAQLLEDFIEPEEGYCLIRSRRGEKANPGKIRRMIRRRQAAGLDTATLQAMLERVDSMTPEDARRGLKCDAEAYIELGGKPFAFTRRKVHRDPGAAVKVSTYGFSDAENPLIFGAWVETDNATPPSDSDSEFIDEFEDFL